MLRINMLAIVLLGLMSSLQATSVQNRQSLVDQCEGIGRKSPGTCVSGLFSDADDKHHSQSRSIITSRSTITPSAEEVYTANPGIGPGGDVFVDSPHFRIYNATGETATNVLTFLESAYTCFVEDQGWITGGINFSDTTIHDGPYTKTNVYVDGTMSPNGVFRVFRGFGYTVVSTRSITTPKDPAHEYGHVLTFAARTWVNQNRTGAWWETMAEWFSDTYRLSPVCARARAKYGLPPGNPETNINFTSVISNSFRPIVYLLSNSSNHYQAWPFLSYLTYNPDNFTGLGRDTIREGFAQYVIGSNETPLHTYARLCTGASIQRVVGRYWARMAFADFGHPTAQELWLKKRSTLDYKNLESCGKGVYKAISDRRPGYMGANINFLKKSGDVTISASILTQGPYTATLSVRDTKTGISRYIDFKEGSVSAFVAASEEVAIVVANTPELVLYYPQWMTDSLLNGPDYRITLKNATVMYL